MAICNKNPKAGAMFPFFRSKIHFVIFGAYLLCCSQLYAQLFSDIKLEGTFEVHPANVALFNSPIVTFNNAIYVAFIDHELRTVVAKKDGDGLWQTSVIEPLTQPDKWHNAPSLAVDSAGYIHTVYNMHSTPWQYKVSKQPENIMEWEFRGQYGGELPGKSVPAASNCEGDCYEAWLGEGTAHIPGNQITYPFMTADRNGVIYVAYRECLNCSTSDYFARQWSGGISRYDVSTGTWHRVGGVGPWATDEEYVPLGIKLYFDLSNRMHVSWVWYKHYVPDNSQHLAPNYPSYAYSDDGGTTFKKIDGTALDLPIGFSASDNIIDPSWVEPHDRGYFYGYTEITADPLGIPYILLLPRTTGNVANSFVSYDESSGWLSPTKTPWAAGRILFQPGGTLNAISSGLRLHQSLDLGATWNLTEIAVSEGPYNYVPDYSFSGQDNQVRVQTIRINGTQATLKIWTIKFLSEAQRPPRPPIEIKVKSP